MEGFDKHNDINGNSHRKHHKHTPQFNNNDNGERGIRYAFHAESSEDIKKSYVKNNPLSGITFGRLTRLFVIKEYERWTSKKSVDDDDNGNGMKNGGGGIDWLIYPGRITALLCLSVFNSLLALVETLYVTLFLRDVMDWVRMDKQAPVFVLGHPRTGTTMLHSLLALDEERFGICDTFAAGFPTAFLWFESVGKRLFAGLLSPTRPMDNMPLHFDLPQEDELATCLLLGGRCSPYTSLYFMRDECHYRRFQCFTADDGVTKEELETWCEAFGTLLLKLKARDVLKRRAHRDSYYPSPRRLLLKSPCHTGRVRLLKRLFPNAKFVYVHRDPFEVFLSGAHMASTTYGYMFLQRPTDDMLLEYILKQGELLVGEYLKCVDEGILNDENLVQVSFSDLAANPEGTIKTIYNAFGWDSFHQSSMSSYPEKLRQQCLSLKGYKRNKFDSVILNDDLIKAIQYRWRDHFERFGYSSSYRKKL